jgi:hypothetical protein
MNNLNWELEKMGKNYNKWKHAQNEEMSCWLGVRHKLSNERYLDIKKKYWLKMLSRLGQNKSDLEVGYVLEIGNGPSGLFLLANDNDNYHCVDPLNNFYTREFPWVFGRQKIFSVKAEKFSHHFPYKRIYAIKCIDHCDNIDAFLISLNSSLDENGLLYLAVNTHNYKFIKLIWRKFQPLIEPHHPYQYSMSGYASIVSKYFFIHKIIDIEDLIVEVNNESSDKYIGTVQPENCLEKRAFFWHTLKKKKIDKEIVGKILVKFLSTIGYPPHDFKNKGKSLFRHKVFVLKKKGLVGE